METCGGDQAVFSLKRRKIGGTRFAPDRHAPDNPRTQLATRARYNHGSAVMNHHDSPLASVLQTRLASRTARVGLAYVGLPLLVELARGGYEAVGFDLDARK